MLPPKVDRDSSILLGTAMGVSHEILRGLMVVYGVADTEAEIEIISAS